jgi:hypothetical protein
VTCQATADERRDHVGQGLPEHVFLHVPHDKRYCLQIREELTEAGDRVSVCGRVE